tara:strand:+ start:1685 stop:1936 length:252 start_codon:yes stop_codon:yes gene_type:complete
VDRIANGLCHQITDEGFQAIPAVARLTMRNTASLLGLAQAGVGLTLLLRLAALHGVDDPAAPSFGPARSLGFCHDGGTAADCR